MSRLEHVHRDEGLDRFVNGGSTYPEGLVEFAFGRKPLSRLQPALQHHVLDESRGLVRGRTLGQWLEADCQFSTAPSWSRWLMARYRSAHQALVDD